MPQSGWDVRYNAERCYERKHRAAGMHVTTQSVVTRGINFYTGSHALRGSVNKMTSYESVIVGEKEK
jgi:hypothetical protein